MKLTPMNRSIKPAKCKNCKAAFTLSRPGQKVCGLDCAQALAVSARLKVERIEAKREAYVTRQKIEALRPRAWWLAKAKTALHAYVRLRDEGKECISCDTILMKLGRVGGDYDAGHFRSVGSAKHLEFVLENIHGQCKHCNDYLGANPQEYERRLRIRYGNEYVEKILQDNTPRKLTIADFQAIEAEFKQKLKELLKEKVAKWHALEI